MLTPQINVALLEGSREPQTAEEKGYVALIGVRGPRESWPHQDKPCSECGQTFRTIGFPTPTAGGWFFHKVCPKCKAVAQRAEEIALKNREARAREREIQTELPPKKKWSRE